MSNYRTMMETNGRLNQSRRKIQSDREYLQAIVNATGSDSDANAMALDGLVIVEIIDGHTTKAYLDTGCQYNDDRMRYLESNDLTQDCQKEINGTSLKDEIEKQIAYEVSVAIATKRFESIQEYFDDSTNLVGIQMPVEFQQDGLPLTLKQNQDSFYWDEEERGEYDASDYD